MSDPDAAVRASRYALLPLGLAVFAGLSLLLRVVLVATSHDVPLGVGLAAIGVGFVTDVVAFGYASLPVVVWLTCVPSRVYATAAHRRLGFVLWCLLVYVLVFEIAAEWFFWDEFSSRFNFVAIDYLVYTREVMGNVIESYPVGIILPALLVPAVAIVLLARRRVGAALAAEGRFKTRWRTGLLWTTPFLAGVLFTSHDTAAFSDNHVADEIAANGLESLVYAYKSNRLDYGQFYATLDEREVAHRLRRLTGGATAGDGVVAAEDTVEHAITRTVTNAGPELRHNVVLVCVESLSARFVGVWGDKRGQRGTTPRLDELAPKSLMFTRLYSTGTRTVRGLEALSLSVPPTPGRSVVKRPGNEGLFSVGQIFRDRGYDTRFVYGGYGYFDNMNHFFASNGFDVVDRTDMGEDEITFANVWGVCDEDLFGRTLREADASYAAQRPFFSFVMTTSNHRPFTYPEGKIDIPSGDGRDGAVKYTDYAIGAFLDAAAERPWFDDTIFVIVADHCASSRGRTDLPVDQFHIPMLIYAPKIVEPGVFDGICSQIDVAPMLCGRLRFSYESRFFGVDAMRTPPDRALVGNYLHVGLLRGDMLATLGPRKSERCERVAGEGELEPVPLDLELVRDAISYYQGADAVLTRATENR